MMRDCISRELANRASAARHMKCFYDDAQLFSMLSRVGSCRELRRFLSAVIHLRPSRAQIDRALEIIENDQALDRFAAVALAVKERSA